MATKEGVEVRVEMDTSRTLRIPNPLSHDDIKHYEEAAAGYAKLKNAR